MNKYLIYHKIKTLINISMSNDHGGLVDHFDIDGFTFSQDITATSGWSDFWVSKKEVEALNMIDAINIFRKDLDKIISKISLIGQAYINFYNQSFLIHNLNNLDNIFFIKYITDRGATPLHFDNNSLDYFNKIPKFDNSDSCFRFLKECINTTGYIPKLLTLFPVLESLSGYIERVNDKAEKYTTYDIEKMKEITGNDLYNKLYGKPNGLRHKIMHGEFINTDEDYVGIIYKKIIEYLNKTYSINISLDVVHPQRNFYENYEFSNMYLKTSKKEFIDLILCENELNDKFKNNTASFKNYELVVDIKNY